jgi:hypothetical protein
LEFSDEDDRSLHRFSSPTSPKSPRSPLSGTRPKKLTVLTPLSKTASQSTISLPSSQKSVIPTVSSVTLPPALYYPSESLSFGVQASPLGAFSSLSPMMTHSSTSTSYNSTSDPLASTQPLPPIGGLAPLMSHSSSYNNPNFVGVGITKNTKQFLSNLTPDTFSSYDNEHEYDL